MTPSDPFTCDLPSEHASRPAPGTETLTSAAGVTAAELAWDRNPRNPQRQAKIVQNMDNFLRHVARYRRRKILNVSA